jgi:uncharacterized protein
MTTLPDTPPPQDDRLGPDDFDAQDSALDAMREHDENTPTWEFCEGFMTALICTRRPVEPDEYWPVLLGDGFVPAQHMEFVWRWNRRWREIETALDADVETLDDERIFMPELLDERGAIAALPEEERDGMNRQNTPAFGQLWAFGFMFAVQFWADEWAAPRDKEAAQLLDDALDAIAGLTEDDKGTTAIPASDEGEPPPGMSQQRMDHLGEVIWAVYALRQLWLSIGPRVEAARKAQTPGRNDPCFCGSGKKYKKCHGA